MLRCLAMENDARSLDQKTHDWKSLMSLVFISKLLTAGDLTSGTKVQPLFALKSAGAKREAIVL
jgi:hypothetical protein